MVANQKRHPSSNSISRGTPGRSLDHSEGRKQNISNLGSPPKGLATFPLQNDEKKGVGLRSNNFTLPGRNKPVVTIGNSKRNKNFLSNRQTDVQKSLLQVFQHLNSDGDDFLSQPSYKSPGFSTPDQWNEDIKMQRGTNLERRIELEERRYLENGWPSRSKDIISQELAFEKERLKLKSDIEEKEAYNIEKELESLKRQLDHKNQLLENMEMKMKIDQIDNAVALNAALAAAAKATAAAESAAQSAANAVAQSAANAAKAANAQKCPPESPPDGSDGSDESDGSDGDESDESDGSDGKKQNTSVPKIPGNDPDADRSKEQMRLFKDQIYIMEKTRPDVTRCKTIVQAMRDKGLMLKGKENWADIKDHLKILQDSEHWPHYLLDLEAEVWDPEAKENPLEAKVRKEMYIILRDIVDEKHVAKIRAVQNKGDKHNGQALFRVLDEYFAIGKRDGDVLNAGIAMRSCSMKTTGMAVTNYGIELLKLIKVLEDIGIVTNERLEGIPIYLKGLSSSFHAIRMSIENAMEDNEDKDWTLVEIMHMVERKAVKYDLTNVTAQAKVSQNVQDTAKGKNGKLSKATKKKNKEKKTLEALQLQVKQLQASATSSTGKNSSNMCNHGKECWLTDCKYQHEPGHKPAINPKTFTCATCGKNGHKSSECGKCYRCGAKDHIASACPKKGRAEGQSRKAVSFQGAQEAGAAEIERPVMMCL